MPFLDVSGYKVHYQLDFRSKDAETLVFIHGLGVDLTMWQNFIPFLPSSYNLLLYDIYGHGLTNRGDQQITVDLVRHELSHLLKHLGIFKYHLIGNGFGGIVGLDFANHYPLRVQTLTLMSTPFYFPDELYLYEYENRTDTMINHPADYAEELVEKMVYPITEEKHRVIVEAFNRLDPYTYADVLELLMPTDDHNFLADLQKLKVPTLILHGEFDPIYPANLSMIYSSYIKRNRFIIVPNASNLVTMDQPDFVADCISQFITKPNPVQFSATHQLLVEKLNHIIQTGYRKEALIASLDIRVMGQFSVRWKGNRVIGKWNQRRAKELLLYLAIHKKVQRTDLLTLFHADRSEEDAKNALRVQLAHLKSIFQHHSDDTMLHALVITREYVSLNALIECDLIDYIRDIERLTLGERPLKNQIAFYHRMITNYSTNFLSDYSGDWVHDFTVDIEWKLSFSFKYLLEETQKHGMYYDAKRLINVSQAVEPYDGYCEEELEKLVRKI